MAAAVRIGADQRAEEFMAAVAASLERTGECPKSAALKVGVDLGTAYTVMVVLDDRDRPLASEMEFAQVIKDGLVVDYFGAVQLVRRLKEKLEARLGRELSQAATAVPPGTGERDQATHRHVLESAGLSVAGVLGEPEAANLVLGVTDGAVMDVGGGTTGLSILEGGRVVASYDEATGGTHLTLVIAGHFKIDFLAAEKIKCDPARRREVLPLVRPVLEKMGSIARRYVSQHQVPAIYLVGGTAALTGSEEVIARETGLPVHKPAHELLVTPAGIALACAPAS